MDETTGEIRNLLRQVWLRVEPRAWETDGVPFKGAVVVQSNCGPLVLANRYVIASGPRQWTTVHELVDPNDLGTTHGVKLPWEK
jgi:hypothetical protein